MEAIARQENIGAVRQTALPSLYLELTKMRLSALVVITTIVGFLMGGLGAVDWARLLWTSIGVALTAGGANTFNQWMEVDRDRLMKRTRIRPIPSKALTRRHAFLFGLVISIAGPAILLARVNLLAALLAILTWLIYVGIYTPLKPVNSLCTLFGAVVGAIPPVIGWVAASGSIGFGALILAAVLFVWQIPHFLALAWIYRDEYARGGFRVLPVIDPTGHSTFRMAMLYSLCLIPVGFSGLIVGMSGWLYGIGALLLGGVMLLLSIDLYRRKGALQARRLFYASLIYLPALLGLMVIDKGPALELGPQYGNVATRHLSSPPEGPASSR